MRRRVFWSTFFGHFILMVLIFSEQTSTGTLTLPCASDTTSCGVAAVEPATYRIVGGGEARIGAWPWIVLLVELGYSSCGGSIISDRFILSAAHCFKGLSNNPGRWQVVAGKHHLNKVDPGQQTVQVLKILMHGDYNITTVENDIALLVLAQPLTFSDVIQPICLPTAEQGVTAGEICLLAGWGATRGTANEMVLNQVLLPIIPDDVCSLVEWYGDDFIANTTFCAGYEEGGKDACTGDSGGPLICKRDGKWFAQGISSWGYGCAEYKWPGIYTDVTKYLSWITSGMKQNSNCGNVIG
ncbi:unnamed protein product [Lymnaea stagnalis]|uniref:Peptidase S1 domain-containing protein n=1 Tax=Lymnaea stagnalis TaxID=6523 RepID=A0AAV2H2T5_LYMST